MNLIVFFSLLSTYTVAADADAASSLRGAPRRLSHLDQEAEEHGFVEQLPVLAQHKCPASEPTPGSSCADLVGERCGYRYISVPFVDFGGELGCIWSYPYQCKPSVVSICQDDGTWSYPYMMALDDGFECDTTKPDQSKPYQPCEPTGSTNHENAV